MILIFMRSRCTFAWVFYCNFPPNVGGMILIRESVSNIWKSHRITSATSACKALYQCSGHQYLCFCFAQCQWTPSMQKSFGDTFTFMLFTVCSTVQQYNVILRCEGEVFSQCRSNGEEPVSNLRDANILQWHVINFWSTIVQHQQTGCSIWLNPSQRFIIVALRSCAAWTLRAAFYGRLDTAYNIHTRLLHGNRAARWGLSYLQLLDRSMIFGSRVSHFRYRFSITFICMVILYISALHLHHIFTSI